MCLKEEGPILSHHVEVASRDAAYSLHQCPRGAWPAGIWFSLSYVSLPPLHVGCCPSGWLSPPFEQDSPPSSLPQNENRHASLSRGSRLRYWLSPLSSAHLWEQASSHLPCGYQVVLFQAPTILHRAGGPYIYSIDHITLGIAPLTIKDQGRAIARIPARCYAARKTTTRTPCCCCTPVIAVGRSLASWLQLLSGYVVHKHRGSLDQVGLAWVGLRVEAAPGHLRL